MWKLTSLLFLMLITHLQGQPNYCLENWSSCGRLAPFEPRVPHKCWTRILQTEGQSIEDFQVVSSSHIYAVGKTTFYRSFNRGKSWQTSPIPNIPNPNKVLIHFISQNTGYLAGKSFQSPFASFVFKTIDGGSTWNLIYNTNQIDELWDLEARADGLVFIVSQSNQKIYVDFTADDFKSMETGSYGPVWGRFPTIEFRDNGHAIINTRDDLLLTTDGAKTWKPIEQLPESMFLDVKVLGGKYYRVTRKSIEQSSDGQNWAKKDFGFNYKQASGGLGMITSQEFWFGGMYTRDYACTLVDQPPDFDQIEQNASGTLVGKSSHNTLQIYDCLDDNRYDHTFFAKPFNLPSAGSIRSLSLDNHQSSGAVAGCSFPLPGCWINESSVDYPLFWYFEGNGRTYNFRVDDPGQEDQFAILAGNLSTLEVLACDEQNQFDQDGLTATIQTKIGEHYYVLVDPEDFREIKLFVSTAQLTSSNDVPQPEVLIYPSMFTNQILCETSILKGSLELWALNGVLIHSTDDRRLETTGVPPGTYLVRFITPAFSVTKLATKFN